MIVVALSAVKEVLFGISHRADRISTAIYQYLLACVDARLCRCSIMVICVFLCVQEAIGKKSLH